MNVIRHTLEKLQDPTNILEGNRYEFIIHIEVEEDDELYMENGVYIKLIYAELPQESRIVQYHVYEEITNNPLDFELEDDELAELKEFCRSQVQ
ncbi:DUF6509 family protein [Fictibacillus terranigra]|uniref:DUF6509 family protein n=1 Tax=Fictibacillus terranigra TaxID=3058424 RepID=A0ABT8E5C8_9BACL|nr:DUF6509 family protein [Fictibacillus sp. CENA-BCM004]MDN4073113.1 DUF6509 family protein [Fictibacillus sp. CENA-BCM004]